MILENTTVHHVHIWLKDQKDKQDLITGLYELATISHIRDLHVGVPAGPGNEVVESSYDAALLILCDSPEALNAYNEDPIHQRIMAKFGPLCSKYIVQNSVNA